MANAPKRVPSSTEFYAPGLDTVTGSDDGAPMKIYRPDGSVLDRDDGVPVEIVFYGPDGRLFRSLKRERLKAQARINAEITDPDAREEAEEEAVLDAIAGMVKSWNVTYKDGSAAPHDRDTVKRFLRSFPAARDQGEMFISNRANFTKARSKT